MARRCGWCTDDPLYRDYHDREWGVPVHDDRTLFEFLILEGAQAGLSWLTVLRKRENYRHALAGFDPAVLAEWGPEQLAPLLEDPGLIRNRLKVQSIPRNAAAALEIQAQHGSLNDYLWALVDGRPVVNRFASLAEVPTRTPLSDHLARDLKRRGCNFVGSTICYAYMQAVGLVMDHTTDCFRHAELAGS